MPSHRWSEPQRDHFRTERFCKRCDLVKVTRHEPSVLPWVEFERDGKRVIFEGGRTPPCEEAVSNEQQPQT
jgi:hypothetical protein